MEINDAISNERQKYTADLILAKSSSDGTIQHVSYVDDEFLFVKVNQTTKIFMHNQNYTPVC